jgi:hypothetical protein
MLLGPVLFAVLRRPHLWVEAARTWLAFVPAGWWRERPFLPLPRRAYWRWRMATAYGDPGASPRPGDVVDFLEWRRSLRGW